MEAFFPGILIADLCGFRQVFSQPSYRLFCGYIVGLLIGNGRKTTRAIASTAFWIDRCGSTWEKFLSFAVWNPNELIPPLVKLVISKLGNRLLIANHYVIALDSTLVTKRAKKMIGVQNWRQREKSQIGHHWMIGGLLARIGNRLIALPLMGRLIYGPKSRCAFTVGKTGIAKPTTFFDVAIALVLSITAQLQNAPPLVVADAYFSTASLINPLIDNSIGLVTRLRRDRVGFWDSAHKQRTPLRDWLLEFQPQSAEVWLYGKKQSISFVEKDLFLRGVGRKVRVVVIATAGEPIILMSTAMSLTAAQIVEIYAGRFAIELAIRQMKSHLGFGDYQATTPVAFLRSIQLICCATVIGLLMMIETQWGVSTNAGDVQFSFLEFRRHLRHYAIKRLIGQKFATDADLSEIQSDIEPILRLVA